MPELPEVETVRAGLERHVVGRTITDVTVLSDRAVRHEVAGAEGITAALQGRRIAAAVRRGKFCWLPLVSGAEVQTALLLHLGMSGQMLVSAASDERAAGGELDAGGDHGPGRSVQHSQHPHLRIRARLDDASVLDFVDQRTFGYWRTSPLVATADGQAGGAGSALPVVPAPVAHIARDLLDPAFDVDAAVAAVQRRSTTLKRALLDQQWVSGVGNIYADESLWVARLHGDLPVAAVGRDDVLRLLDAAAAVMRSAVAAGGTSFDALYVNVNGQSGYFDRSLAVYGKAGQPCRRCGAAVVRQRFANRSSYFCPVCQPSPSP